MSENKIFRIGGVPEHFNLPWHLAIENGNFNKAGLNVEWVDYPGGTGAMTEALENGSLDFAVSLTEGIAAKISQGGHFRILQNFVVSPLNWGVYVANRASYNSPSELEGKQFAISRMGSGSHLMAFVYARQNHWTLKTDQLVIANDLKGMVDALTNEEADILLWEKYTTQPYVSNGLLKLIDETTPNWPAFVIAVRDDLIKEQTPAIKTLQQVINKANEDFMRDSDSIKKLAKRFEMSVKDAENWFNQTKWATGNQVDKDNLDAVIDTLYQLSLIDKKPDPWNLCSPLTALEQNV